QNAYEAYIVGGCVRDMLRGHKPNDWDIATSATPAQVKQIFARTYDTGIAHGTVTVIINKDHFEVTTYRTEGEYTDHRRPNDVTFVTDIYEDLSRRDFTMNAIAFNPRSGYIDPYDGQADINNRIIRCVRNASERFLEDALRILRAVRFAAQLNFTIDDVTMQNIYKLNHLLAYISKERIRDEFTKICLAKSTEGLIIIQKLELAKYISKYLEPICASENYSQIINTISKLEPDVVTRYSALLIQFADIAQPFMKDLKWDNKTIKNVNLIVQHYPYLGPENAGQQPVDLVAINIYKRVIKKLLYHMGPELFDKYLNLKSVSKSVEVAKQLKAEIIDNNECYNLKMLAITGDDLIAAGTPKGASVGDKLQFALDYVMTYPAKNDKQHLLNLLQ
ncbi:MAG: hypothetical protein BEN18_04225, partial [Epulopiscium sp. Nuni2H_MBin001]